MREPRQALRLPPHYMKIENARRQPWFTMLAASSSKDQTGRDAPEETTMRMFDVQGVEIRTSCDKVFEFLRNPKNLPQWAQAFVSAEDGRARLETPAGAVDIGLSVTADCETGTVDWRLEFPDGSVGLAQSQLTGPR